VVIVRGVASLRDLQYVESKFRLYVRQPVFLIGDRVAVFFF
jgi:hypothetical protein